MVPQVYTGSRFRYRERLTPTPSYPHIISRATQFPLLFTELSLKPPCQNQALRGSGESGMAKTQTFGVETIVQSVKCLSYKHESLNFIFRAHIKS